MAPAHAKTHSFPWMHFLRAPTRQGSLPYDPRPPIAIPEKAWGVKTVALPFSVKRGGECDYSLFDGRKDAFAYFVHTGNNSEGAAPLPRPHTALPVRPLGL